MYDFLPQLWHGALVTLKLACCALIVGMALAMLSAWGELSRNKLARGLTVGINALLRGLPELLLILMIYFGGSLLLTTLFGTYIEVNAFVAGVFALAIVFSAYAAQVLRGAVQAIPKESVEAGLALGLSRKDVFFHITMPLALQKALPGLSNLWLVLLKDTALVSLIGVGEIMHAAELAIAVTKQSFTFYFAVALFYLLVTALSQLLFNFCRQKWHVST